MGAHGALHRWLLAASLFAGCTVSLGFLVLPMAALFTHQPLGRLVHQLTNRVVVDALELSLETSAIAQAAILLLGTPTAYLIASRRFPLRSLVITLLELPLVL